jgi:hypothetical protein
MVSSGADIKAAAQRVSPISVRLGQKKWAETVGISKKGLKLVQTTKKG